MKKILFVVDEKKIGGVNVLLENLLNKIDLTNLDVTVLILHASGTALSNLNDKIHVMHGTKAFDVVDQDLKYLVKTGRITKALKKCLLSLRMKTNNIKSFILKEREKMGLKDFDVEIAFKSGFCSFVVAYSNSNRKINWVHEDYATYNKTKRYEKTFKKLFNMFDKHVIVSEKAAESFNNIYNQELKSCVIENYIDEEAILKQASNTAYESIHIDKDKINIVSLGRFCTEKGFDRIIRAVKCLKDKYDNLNFKVSILGYGDYELKLKELVKSLNVQDIIEIYNTQNINWNPYAYMKECDAFIMASRSESFGMTRIEALILGLPVITTNVANSDKLIQKEYGIIVENSTFGVYKGLEELFLNPELLYSVKQNVKNYSYGSQNSNILKQVQELLEE